MSNKNFYIGKIYIDFRDWYQVYEQYKTAHNEVGWSKIWYSKKEIDLFLADEPNLKTRKINFLIGNYFHNKTIINRYLTPLIYVTIGYIFGKIL